MLITPCRQDLRRVAAAAFGSQVEWPRRAAETPSRRADWRCHARSLAV